VHASDVRLEQGGLDKGVSPEHHGLGGVGDEYLLLI
jgi:hypothetical protein